MFQFVEGPLPAADGKEKLDLIKERLRDIEGFGDYSFADMTDLGLVPDVVIPPKFMVPDFDRDEKLLMHFFQDNLVVAAVIMYTNLEASRIHTWKDPITAFLRQYQYNSDMAPNRTQLKNMSKREHESFKEYAQRWRDLEAQVAPPMVEREMVTMIVDNLPVFYYEKLVGYMRSSFTDLVFTGERIEVGLKTGKFDYVSLVGASGRSIGTAGAKKKEGDAHTVTSTPAWPKPQQTPHGTHQYAQHHPSFSARAGGSSDTVLAQPRAPTPPQRGAPQASVPTQPHPANNAHFGKDSNTARNYSPRQTQNFTLIPMTYGDLLPSLIANQLLMVILGRIFQLPFPKWYNPSATCTYHGGTPGHSVEQCLALKSKVQGLIEAGWLTFQEDEPNIKTNHLANHGGGAVNAIEVSRYAPLGGRKEEATDIGSLSAKVTHITELSGITRSGCVFTPPSLPMQPANAKGKTKVTEGQNVKVIPASDEDVPTKEFVVGREGCGKKEVSLEEASEFLRII
ncbi:uncharacterized protein [Glycine max]|uniref:uncharacterized protein n=1 Tax=Glycine max TaxID=3847 RepID=UPI0003DEBF09|nr:uncharacterized protein LOC102664875 [Glycine max]|eukprot:XP_006606689.1 uncharacterized protein LOC102664875 [Glycine max]